MEFQIGLKEELLIASPIQRFLNWNKLEMAFNLHFSCMSLDVQVPKYEIFLPNVALKGISDCSFHPFIFPSFFLSFVAPFFLVKLILFVHNWLFVNFTLLLTSRPFFSARPDGAENTVFIPANLYLPKQSEFDSLRFVLVQIERFRGITMAVFPNSRVSWMGMRSADNCMHHQVMFHIEQPDEALNCLPEYVGHILSIPDTPHLQELHSRLLIDGELDLATVLLQFQSHFPLEYACTGVECARQLQHLLNCEIDNEFQGKSDHTQEELKEWRDICLDFLVRSCDLR